jgi:beta-glucosidase
MDIYKDSNASIEERIEDLLCRMTLKEKFGQLGQEYQGNFKEEGSLEKAIKNGQFGSFILSVDPCGGNVENQGGDVPELNRLQRIAIEESRLGIPMLYGRDVIHGHRTVAPIPLAQAASWDRAAVENASSIAALEAASESVHWTFAPMMDICRDPRWGRVIESLGEDPFLASEMAVAMTNGFQGDDTTKFGNILACAKHYAGYGFAEGGRDYDCTEITTSTMYNVVLRPFKAVAKKAGIATFMTGFHQNGGIPVTASEFLLKKVLRTEWGFDGMVISDWGTVTQLPSHGFGEDQEESCKRAINCGVDMEMIDYTYHKHLESLVEKKEIDIAAIDSAVSNILRAKFRAGLFDNPYTDENLRSEILFTEENRKAVREFAAECSVLAKNNNNILPIAKTFSGKIAVVGQMAHEQRALLGSWTLDGRVDETASLYTAFQETYGEDTIVGTTSSLADSQLQVAATADYIICCVGESDKITGETHAICHYELPVGQEEFITALARFNKPIIVVCASGRPLAIKAAENHADALLYVWHGGTECARATADIISGFAEPTGRFPITVPKNGGQIPIYYNRKRVGNDNGPKNVYDDDIFAPLYSFGYGLGYTTFELSEIMVLKEEISVGDGNMVTATLTNTGSKKGTTVVQCYIQDVQASVTRPVKELVNFGRMTLEAGESRQIKLSIDSEALGFYLDSGEFVTEPGVINYNVSLSSDFVFDKLFQIV